MKKLILLLSLTVGPTLKGQSCLNPTGKYYNPSIPEAICKGDFNKDGKMDMATTNFSSGDVTIYLGSGSGSFAEQPSISISSGCQPISIICEDFNSDGNPDLAIEGYNGSGTIGILLGSGNGNFSLTNLFASPGGPSNTLASSDFNMDHVPDLAVANYSGFFSVLTGTGTGTFNSAIYYYLPLGANPVALIPGDFNADGKPDLAITDFNPSDVTVVAGDGTGNFSNPMTFGTGINPYAGYTDDMNGDGKLDLIVTNHGSNDVTILLGSANDSCFHNGSWNNPAVNYPVGFYPERVVTADFNNDTKPDIAIVNYQSGDVSVLLGDGNGGLGSVSNISVGSNPMDLVSHDFNGDGKSDLAIAVSTDDSVVVLTNCTATFSCIAAVSDSIYADVTPHTWDLIAHYSPQITSAKWSWGDGTTSIGLLPSHTYSVASWYNICVTAYTSCGDSATACRNDTLFRMSGNNTTNTMVNINISYTTGQKNLTNDATRISVYPNPNSGQFTISLNSIDTYNIDLYDVNGRHVFNKTVAGTADIDVNTLDNGVYSMTIKNRYSIINKKLLIAH